MFSHENRIKIIYQENGLMGQEKTNFQLLYASIFVYI